MKNLHRFIPFLIFAILLYFPTVSVAQTLSITTSDSEGCSPLLVQFSTNMPGLGAGNYEWNLGNGNTSDVANPVATYLNPGVYTIQAFVNDNGTILTASIQVEVFANPQANFQLSSGATSGCTPFNVQFQDLSTPGSGSITSWNWNFGNGTAQSSTSSINPSVVYQTAGSFSVTLQVADENGCINAHTEVNLIQTSGGPSQLWYPSPNVFCEVPANTMIVNNMTGVSTYSWTTSDGQSSSLPAPSFSFAGFNNVVVTLVATDAQGCSSSRDYTITIGDVIADFDLTDIICFGESFQPDNQSIIANQYEWTFPQGSSNQMEPTIELLTPGWNTVSLEATLNGDCADTKTDSLFIETANANFQLSDPYICVLPHEQEYINYSSTNSLNGGLDYYWILDFETSTTITNPIINYTNNQSLFSDGFHLFYDTLIVTSPNGCIDTAVSQTDIYLPHVWMAIDPLGGCVPFTPDVQPDIHFNVCPYDSIIMHIWSWGDGTIDTALVPPPHTYSDTGMFNLDLTIITALGCVVEESSFVMVGDTTNIAEFEIQPPTTICGSDSLMPFNTSTINTNTFNVTWHLNGDLAGSGYYAYLHPVDTGWMTVSMFINHNLCIEDTTIENAFYVNGPITELVGWHVCEPDPYHYTFNMIKDYGYETFLWDFGDGNTDNLNAPITTHDYTQSLDGWAFLHSYNATTGCEYHDSIQVVVRHPIAQIVADTLDVCAGDTITFESYQSQDEGVINLFSIDGIYQWTFGDSTWHPYTSPYDSSLIYFTMDTVVTHAYSDPGQYEVQLVIVAENACTDTTTIWVNVRKPIPDFDLVTPDNCNPVTVQFDNHTQHDIPIVIWNWNFGPGGTSSLEHPPALQYSNPGAYPITLQVIDSLGCSGSLTQILYSTQPDADFELSTQLMCLTDTLTVTNLSDFLSPTASFTWLIDGVPGPSGFEPSIVFEEQGEHLIDLIVNDGGCIDTAALSNATVMVETAHFQIDTTISGKCSPVFVDFSIDPAVYYFNSIWWDFGDGSTGHVITPQHVYNTPGTYQVSFEAVTTAGCTGVSTIDIPIGGSTVGFQLEPKEICLGDSVHFSLTDSLNLGDFFIDFGDGTGSNQVPISHSYHLPGLNDTVQVFFTWTDINGECPDSDSSFVKIIDVRPRFLAGPNHSQIEGCEPYEVQFINESVNADEYWWDFGDGSTSDLMHPLHAFQSAGEFEVELTISNTQYGCDEVSTQHLITVNPSPTIILEPNPELCFGDSVQIEAIGEHVANYTWSPNSFISDISSPNPIFYPPQSMIYNLHLMSDKDCVADTLIELFVQQAFDLDLSDTALIVGEYLNLDLGERYEVYYEWSPLDGIVQSAGAYPIFQPLESTQYLLEISAYANDSLCFKWTDSLYIDVWWEFTLDVPSVFTPNGDGNNDLLFARGWGIRQLLEFTVYNRWGEQVFFSQDISEGWDGRHRGQIQPGETYYYRVKAETYDGRFLEKEGMVNLIR